jgi:flavin-dependent dehydrogenase
MASGPHSTDFDLVIVGAGFAGLVCARTAAMRGLRVAVVERKLDPGASIHTTGILVKEAAEALDLPAALTRKVRGVRLYGPAMESIDLNSPGYYFLATDTAELLRWLAREAEAAGAHCVFGARFSDAVHEGSNIRVAQPEMTTRYLIGADGAKSRVASAFDLGRNRRFLLGLEAEYRGACGLDPGFLHCLLDRELAPGYLAWMVPGVGITQVGLATLAPAKPDLEALRRKVRDVADFGEASLIGGRGGLIPVGGLVRPFATHGVLLLGDAAGLVSPMTAGGIHNAFHYGRRAAQLVSDYLLDDGPEPSRVLIREVPKYPLKGIMGRLMSLGPPDWAVDAGLRTAAMRLVARQIYFHRRGPGWARGHGKYFKPLSQATGEETSY